MNLRNKILTIFLLTSVPAIAIVGMINYGNVESKITGDILNKLEGIAAVQEKRVEESIERNFERLNGITGRTQLRISLDQFNQDGNTEDAARIEKIISDAKESIPDISTIFIVNLSGKIIFSTDKELVGTSLSSDDVFVNGFNQRALTIDREKDYDPISMCISGPLILNGESLGVLVIKVDPKTIIDITSDYSILENTGESFLAKRTPNGDAMFITTLRFDSDAALNRIIVKERTDVPITNALLGIEGIIPNAVDYRGEQVLAASRHIDSTDWGLVVKIDKSEAFSTINNIRDLSVVTIVIVLALTVGASFYLSKKFTERIRRLSLITQEIAQGQLSTDIIVKGDDEISQLSKDIKKMESSLRDNEQKLLKETRFAAIGELSAKIAHDLRNPLSVIKNSLELMEHARKSSLTDHEKRQFDMMMRAVGRMEHQITEVLDFVRNRKIIREECDLLDLINLAVSSQEVPPDIKIVIPKSGIKTSVDTIQMQVVFSNLIQNALQVVGTQGEIRIRLFRDSNKIVIEIEDSGQGISQENMDKIFEPLFTTRQTGTGLGLASCKNIIENHGGTISARNNPTTFTIKLPTEITINEKSLE